MTISRSHSAWPSSGRASGRWAGVGSRTVHRRSRSAISSSIRQRWGFGGPDGQIRLTAREFALLELLARHPGQIFTRDRLIGALWDADFSAESNIVEVYVRSLRRKVDEGRRDGLIETVRGSGYRLRSGGSA